MKCVDCHRKLPRALKKCVYCGGELKPNDRADDLINCPSCSAQMVKDTLYGVTIDDCPQCHARWLDLGELEELIEKKDEAGVENSLADGDTDDEVARFELKQTKVEYRQCPRCQKPMMRRNYEQISGVMVDSCPDHGIFLDEQEFDRLRAFISTNGPALAKQMRDQERRRHLKKMEHLKKIEKGRQEQRQNRRAHFDHEATDELLGAISTLVELCKSFLPYRHKD